MAEYEHTRTGFGAIGKIGLPAEQVAAIATQELLDFHATGAPVDVHLADQLLLPTALASQMSQYRVAEISTHLMTNAWVIEQFGLAKIAIDENLQLFPEMSVPFGVNCVEGVPQSRIHHRWD